MTGEIKTVTLTGTTYTFTVPQNGRYLFEYAGSYTHGATGDIPAKITRIDKIKPEIITKTYDPSTAVRGPVTVTLVLSESGTVAGWKKVDDMTYTKVYTENQDEIVKFYDLAGNFNTTIISVSWIVPGGGGGG
jgi:hypothetical protein